MEDIEVDYFERDGKQGYRITYWKGGDFKSAFILGQRIAGNGHFRLWRDSENYSRTCLLEEGVDLPKEIHAIAICDAERIRKSILTLRERPSIIDKTRFGDS